MNTGAGEWVSCGNGHPITLLEAAPLREHLSGLHGFPSFGIARLPKADKEAVEMIASALVCGILLTLQTPKSIETGWTEAFSEFARRENVAFVVDVNRLLAPPETLPPIGGRWLLDFLASGQRRRVTEVQGVYVLARSGERGEMAAPIGNTTLLDWLEKLSPEQISKLARADFETWRRRTVRQVARPRHGCFATTSFAWNFPAAREGA